MPCYHRGGSIPKMPEQARLPRAERTNRGCADQIAIDSVETASRAFARSSSHRLRLAMKLAAAHQPTGDVGRLQERALGRKMSRQIPCYGDKGMPSLVAVTPLAKLPHARLEHLIGMEAGILTQERLRKRRDQRIGRVTQEKVTGDKARRRINLLLAVEGVEQSSADLLGRNGQVIKTVAALTR